MSYGEERLRAIAEQAAQEWENPTQADTYDRGFLAGVHQALTFARTRGEDIGDELAELIDRADTRERKTIRHAQLPGFVGWYLYHHEGSWAEISSAVVEAEYTFVHTNKYSLPFTGEVTVMAPLSPVGV